MRSTHAAVQRLIITAALWAAVVVSGQELTRTQISDTLFNADGSRAEGSIRISWKSFTAADGSTIPQNTISVDIIDGVAALSLAPNEGAVPDGTAYMVRYQLRGSRPFTELWVVPATGDPVSVADIRVQSMPPPSTSVSMSQVSGLSSALNEKADRTGPNTFLAPQVFREDAPGTTNPLLGLELNDGSAGVYFRLPPLAGDITYTLPPNDGSPNQALTTDGDGVLFWSSAAGGGAGSGSAYEVLQQGGSSVAQRTVANFTSGFVLSDNVGQLRTDVTPDFGTSAGTITEGNDSRLSDARTPLSHASTHASAGGDAITPLSIGALSRTNDFMVGTSPTDPVLKIQGSMGQAAALQEWRDGAGTLAALITAEGNGFFRELGIAAPLAGATVSQFFEIGGLKRFALSATDGVFDILRYDNSGSFLDRPLRIFRSGNIETTVALDVTDSSVGSGRLGITGDYVELQTVTTPSTPAPGFGRLFFDSSNGELSIMKSSGSTVSLEQGGVGGTSDFLGNYASPIELTISSGSVTLSSGGGPHLLDTESDGATDDWTAMVCAAGESWSVRAASDVRSVVALIANIPNPYGVDLTFDQDGDVALGICQIANTPEIVLFVDEAGEHLYRDLVGGESLTGTTVIPAGSDHIGLNTHADACQNRTDGIQGETCWQVDTKIRYTCVTADLTCDDPSEWVAEAGGVEVNDLETTPPAAILNLEFLIGTGAGTANLVPLSGDLSVTNAGVVTVVDASHSHTGANLSDQHPNTDITADLEEEGQINATVVTGNVIANQLLVGTGANASAYKTVPSCSNATTSKLLYNNSTQTWTCGTDQTGGGGGAWTVLDSTGSTSATCDGGGTYTTFGQLDAAAGELSVGDIFQVLVFAGDDACTTCTTDIRVDVGGRIETVSDLTSGEDLAFEFECTVITNTKGMCHSNYVENTNTDSDIMSTITLNDVSSSSNAFVIQERQCASGDALTLHQAVLLRMNL